MVAQHEVSEINYNCSKKNFKNQIDNEKFKKKTNF